ncbi:HNH endonuclease [Paracoccus litorisediminis]|uniref:hypothetical protein n=1 Tax=Paracoccus litorisediminis TaxID=2006130 RepID=UPI00372DED1F
MPEEAGASVTQRDYDAAWMLELMAELMPCAYCRMPMNYREPKRHPTRDHIWPKAMRSTVGNRTGKLWCCQECNSRKADKTPSEWLAMLRARHETGKWPS